MKPCHVCKDVKEFDCFYKDKYTKTGYAAICKICKDKKRKEYCEKNPNWAKDCRLKSTYGINLEQYNIMFITQQGRCGICSIHQSEFKKSLEVDHCHITNKIRGLICHKCNKAIGLLGDSYESVNAALQYLKNSIGDL
jgi:hypothetical protein